MDPDAALRLIVEAIQDGDMAEAADHAFGLFNWLEGGGFMPDVSREALQALLSMLAE